MTAPEIHDAIAITTIWREARGESWAGKVAVANVIRNRMADPRWLDTPGGVCCQPAQFSCWQDGQVIRFPDDGDTLRECAAAWINSGLDDHVDLSIGANHYHSDKVLPRWAYPYAMTVSIGRHKFYKL